MVPGLMAMHPMVFSFMTMRHPQSSPTVMMFRRPLLGCLIPKPLSFLRPRRYCSRSVTDRRRIDKRLLSRHCS